MDQSNRHSPRIDDSIGRGAASLTHGAPVESRSDELREQQSPADGEPPVESVNDLHEDDGPRADLTREERRARSELARRLRPSAFPATARVLARVAREEQAPDELVEQISGLGARRFENVEQLWEALGGRREVRDLAASDEGPAEGREQPAATAGATGTDATDAADWQPEAAPPRADVEAPIEEVEPEPGPAFEREPEARPTGAATGSWRSGFRFDPRWRNAARVFGVGPATALVEIDAEAAPGRLVVRFGRWTVDTELDNVAGTEVTGPYRWIRTAGPPHLGLDRGLTFATNGDRGVCIRFHRSVRGIEPLGLLRHPALTVTVEDVDGLVARLA